MCSVQCTYGRGFTNNTINTLVDETIASERAHSQLEIQVL